MKISNSVITWAERTNEDNKELIIGLLVPSFITFNVLFVLRGSSLGLLAGFYLTSYLYQFIKFSA